MSGAKDFDKRAADFGAAMWQASRWKGIYGAAYSSRLLKALEIAETACRDLRSLLIEDGAIAKEVRDHEHLEPKIIGDLPIPSPLSAEHREPS